MAVLRERRGLHDGDSVRGRTARKDPTCHVDHRTGVEVCDRLVRLDRTAADGADEAGSRSSGLHDGSTHVAKRFDAVARGRMRREEPAAGRAFDLREPRERVDHRGGGMARPLRGVAARVATERRTSDGPAAAICKSLSVVMLPTLTDGTPAAHLDLGPVSDRATAT